MVKLVVFDFLNDPSIRHSGLIYNIFFLIKLLIDI